MSDGETPADAGAEEMPVHPAPAEEEAGRALAGAAAVVRRLREPGGCPWDRQQTHASLRRFAIEEAFELAEAVEQGDDDGMEDELGDLLLQVLLHSRIAQEEGRFNLGSVARRLAGKLIRRHPHVFGSLEAEDAGAVRQIWRQAKDAEAVDKAAAGAVDGEPQAGEPGEVTESSILPRPKPTLPALFASQRMQSAAAEAGFDWRQPEDAVDKVAEEVDELVAARHQGSRDDLQDELGDLLFMVVNIARLLDLDAEGALRRANSKFYRRFSQMEQLAAEAGLSMAEMEIEDLDAMWDQVKAQE